MHDKLEWVQKEEPTCSKEVGLSKSDIGHGLSNYDGVHDVPTPRLSKRVAVEEDALEGFVVPERIREHNAASRPHLDVTDIQILQGES